MLFEKPIKRTLSILTVFLIVVLVSFLTLSDITTKEAQNTSTQKDKPVTISATGTEYLDPQIPATSKHGNKPERKSHPQLDSLLHLPFGAAQLAQMNTFLEESDAQIIPESALAIVRAGLPNEQTVALTLVALEHWARSSPDAALTFSFTYLDAQAIQQAIPTVIYAACEESDIPADCVAELPYSVEIDHALMAISDALGGAKALQNSLDGKANYVPENALLWASGVKNRDLRSTAISNIVNIWVTSDASVALEWLLFNSEYENLATIAAAKLAKKDPWNALQIASVISNNKLQLREDIYRAVIAAQVDQGEYETVVLILESLPDKKQLDRYYNEFLEQWSLDDPRNAAESAMTLPDGLHRDRLVATALKYWGEQEPHQALDFASKLPTENLRRNAWTTIMQSWSQEDVGSVLTWLEQQTASVTLDKSIARAVDRLVGSELPKNSLADLVNNIDDKDLHQTMIMRIENHSQMITDQ